MKLSVWMRRTLEECYEARSRDPQAVSLPWPVGGTWFCPGCGTRAEERDRLVVCPTCDRCLNEFIPDLIRVHPHRRFPGTHRGYER